MSLGLLKSENEGEIISGEVSFLKTASVLEKFKRSNLPHGKTNLKLHNKFNDSEKLMCEVERRVGTRAAPESGYFLFRDGR
ncbi:hypothetical protein TNCV_814371 [Trichonephila clavipes]|nr:hypothetical protein TNCV_814371 [Trichonephila clavipes]